MKYVRYLNRKYILCEFLDNDSFVKQWSVQLLDISLQ